MQLANQEAQRFNHEYIGTEHILLGLIQEGSGVAANVLQNLDIDLRKVRREVEKIVQTGPGGDQFVRGKLPQTPRAKKVIECAVEEARKLNHNYVGSEHLLLGLLREEEGVAAQVLINFGLNLADVRAEVLNLLGGPSGTSAEAPPMNRSKTPALDGLGRDLTDQARLGKLAPLIGRTAELQAVFEILGSRDPLDPLLLGNPGVGKRSIAAGLADAIVRRRVPEWLRGHRIVELSVARAWESSRNWKVASERLREAFGEARRGPNIILFLPDVVATLWIAGVELASGGGHAEVLLAIREGRCPCILAATPADYARCVDHWGPLEPAVQPVPIRPTTVEETLAILVGVRERYETHHHVLVDGPALPAIAAAADRLRGALPGEAVQLLDRCAARARLKAWQLSPSSDPAVVELDEQIRQFNLDKESAVAAQEFDRALQLRDQADRLKKRRAELVADKREPAAVLDVATVEDVIRDLTPPA
jgi:ATP-dependent Clp protease ATP-binding subunit ClpC